MSSFLFDYSIFFNYYTNPINVISNGKLYEKNIPSKKSITLSNFITTNNGLSLYIDTIPNNGFLDNILFSKLSSSIPFDYHYHFGLRKCSKKEQNNGKTGIVFFHITDYNLHYSDPKHHIKCWFYDNEPITTDFEIFKSKKCINDAYTMNKYSDDDIHIIFELITKPFTSTINRKGGKPRVKRTSKKIRKTVKRKSKTYSIR